MKLYDTLSGAVKPLELRSPEHVDMYVCGPTVYDHPHLGHARSSLTYDVLRRYLSWCGYEVRHVANITDIDDKIIKRANEEGRSESEVATEWEAVYKDVMAALGVLAPHDTPHATEWVAEMVAFIEELVGNDSAYVTDSGVYLRVHKVPGYCDLVHRDLADLAESAGSRVAVDETKEDPLDFALWKAAKPGEPTWPSPWGEGRPGWHIECAAMSLGLLGDGFDLHGGGDDLVFPHHTNERAEAIGAGREFARHWIHNAMLNVDGAKMAKSLGNFRTVGELLEEHPQNGRAFRLLVLQTHYRKTMEVNAELMASSRTAAARLDALARRACLTRAQVVDDLEAAGNEAADAVGAFRQAMDNDMGTPEALGVIFELVRKANASIDAGDDCSAELSMTALKLAAVLGLEVIDETPDTEIDDLVAQRQAAREAKDFALADSIRDQLAEMGVVVEDTAGGCSWHRDC